MSSTKKIIDEFTDLPVSRQRKYQLRHPERGQEASQRYRRSEKRKAAQRRYYLKKLSTAKTIDTMIN